jgi:competence protein ComEA
MKHTSHSFVRFVITALGALSLWVAAAGTVEAQGRGSGSAPSAAEAGEPVVDIQSASAEELETLPGVGPARARAIIEHRTRTPFRRAEDLMRVSGIGRATFRAIRSRITVGGVRASGDAEE